MRNFASRALACAALTLVAMLVVPTQALSQQASPEDGRPPHKLVLGYQDQQTGVFHALPMAIPDATVPPVAGTITLTLHITLKTALATGAKVLCSSQLLSAYTSAAGSHTYQELGYAFATVSGSTATCTVAVPYSWQFPAVATGDIETLTGTYTAEIFNPPSTTTPTLPLVRESSSAFVSLTGNNIFTVTTLAYSANVTL